MQKIFFSIIMLLLATAGLAQQKCYWVFFTDKDNTEFDPYTYFDAKAISRYQQCGADLYDISNYPVNESYSNTVAGYSDELFGTSRWLNAVGITTTQENAILIEQLPFVDRVQEIATTSTIAQYDYSTNDDIVVHEKNIVLSDQLKRFKGQYFMDKGIDGKGLRICVLDAGFPKVDTHPAFKHLRDNHQIIATYNFPKRCENVYGWGTHGTMVLSCIAGINDTVKLGLATGAEFLLGRTEIDPEPFKEEVWWAEGAEWADRNGADIINSSLGYGKERHWTKDMDGTSYVAKAANKAVEKGILVCNSAGNEGDDKHWMTIITPSDAENVLCVGGIENNLDDYRHIDFSSYGPSADKRLKPNVCAFGCATVADPSGNGFTSAYGTSFSSPLTAGFCACAWQTRRDLTALQMKAEIEKSADLYPYFDYAFGYGVPQADYFTGDRVEPQRSFEIFEDKDYIRIHFIEPELSTPEYVFINVQGSDEVLLGYYKLLNNDNKDIKMRRDSLGAGTRLNVSYKGFADSYHLDGDHEILRPFNGKDPKVVALNNNTFPAIKRENWEVKRHLQGDWYLPTDTWNGYNRHISYGKRFLYGKSYKLGLGYNFGLYRFVDKYEFTSPIDPSITKTAKLTMRSAQLGAEVFQRVVNRLWGINWDLGVWGNVACTRRVKLYTPTSIHDAEGNPYCNETVKELYTGCRQLNRFQYGATTRLSYGLSAGINIGVYATYRLSDVITGYSPIINTTDQPSPWSFGIEVEL